jgi:transcriptional regulator with XRE-family HTH domain
VSHEQSAPDPVDIAVGQNLRLRRKALGKSQEQLAEALGITFQQVQKYEGGKNRISASKLQAAADFLGCHPGELFPAAGGAVPVDAKLQHAARRVELCRPGLITQMTQLAPDALFSLANVVSAILKPAELALASHGGTPSDHLVLEVH